MFASAVEAVVEGLGELVARLLESVARLLESVAKVVVVVGGAVDFGLVSRGALVVFVVVGVCACFETCGAC